MDGLDFIRKAGTLLSFIRGEDQNGGRQILKKQVNMAKQMRFTIFGVGSGSLGGVSFHDRPFFITMPADVERVYQPETIESPAALQVDCAREAAVISVFGRETVIAEAGLSITRFRDAQNKLHWMAVGLATDRLITINHPALGDYDLDRPLPLVRGTAPFSPSGKACPTTADGDFVLNEISSAAVQAELISAREPVAQT